MSRPAATGGGLQLVLPRNNPPTAGQGQGQGARCISGGARVATACALPCWPAAAASS